MRIRIREGHEGLKLEDVKSRRIVILEDRVILPELGKEIVLYRDAQWCISAAIGSLQDGANKVFWSVKGEPLQTGEFTIVEYNDGEYNCSLTLAHKWAGAVIDINTFKKEVVLINRITSFSVYYKHDKFYHSAVNDDENRYFILDGCSRTGVYTPGEDFDINLHLKIINIK